MIDEFVLSVAEKYPGVPITALHEICVFAINKAEKLNKAEVRRLNCAVKAEKQRYKDLLKAIAVDRGLGIDD